MPSGQFSSSFAAAFPNLAAPSNKDAFYSYPSSSSSPQAIVFPSNLSSADDNPAPVPVSASPAALFLAAFSSPAPSILQDADGDVVSGYTLGGIIGHGASSVIRKANSSSGDVVAVKVIRYSDLAKRPDATFARKRVKHEADVWSTLSHEHLLPLFSAVHTNHADYFFTLYCPAGSLYDILKRDGCPALPQDDAGMMFRQIVRGLRYLHEIALYVHRDIKLENVLVDEMGVCRIGDFGMSRKVGELDESDFESTANDVKPESLQPSHANHPTVHRAVSLVVHNHTRRPGLPTSFSRNHDTARHRNSTSSTHPAHSQVFQPGSLPYASPELLLPQLSGPLLPHPAQDIWALGVLLYCLLAGRLPFYDSFEPRLQMKILNGMYEVPPDIGRGAERVLQGCLDRSIATRWSIARVDELAWGVGWGAEGDDATVAEFDEECQLPSSNKSNPSSRSHSHPPEYFVSETPGWQQKEQRSRPSLEAALRRSTSRLRRSLSRAPMITRPSSSLSPKLVRGNSWQCGSPSPIITAIDTSPLALYDDSALIITPSPSVERGRGRRLRKLDIHDPSRSPSPSPTTPSDIVGRSPDRPLATISSHDRGRSYSRGRQKYGRGMRSLNSDNFYFPGGLDVFEEGADWVAENQPTTSSSSGKDVSSPLSTMSLKHDDEQLDQILSPPKLPFVRLALGSLSPKKKRPGSVPPNGMVMWRTVASPSLHPPRPTTKGSTPVGGFPRRLKKSKSYEHSKV